MNDSAGKFGRDQLGQAADDEKRRMKQAEQAKAFPENLLPVEKPNSLLKNSNDEFLGIRNTMYC